MVKIKLSRWVEKVPTEGKDGKVKVVDKNADITDILNYLLRSIDPNDDRVKGFDAFKRQHRITDAFVKAEKDSYLVLDDADHDFLCDLIKEKIESRFASEEKIYKAVNDFVDAKNNK